MSGSPRFEDVQPGRLVRRALRDDPGVAYHLYVPRSGGRGAPLFVAVHGISGNARSHARAFCRLAEERGAVLAAPVFEAPRFDDYQRLGRTGRGDRADEALVRIAGELGDELGARTERLHLFGFSAGAQFVHRFALAHPGRVARAVAAAAGWYTSPDPERRYPAGIAPSRRLPGVRFEPRAFLRVPLLVVVGARDTRRDDSLRQGPRIDGRQGSTRVERAGQFARAMREAAVGLGLEPRVELHVLPDGTHSFARCIAQCGLGELAFSFLFGDKACDGRAREG